MPRFKAIPEAHLILLKDDQILMLRRINTGYEDRKYSVIAGHSDGNESITHAIAREAKEEAAIEINSNDLGFISRVTSLGTGRANFDLLHHGPMEWRTREYGAPKLRRSLLVSNILVAEQQSALFPRRN